MRGYCSLVLMLLQSLYNAQHGTALALQVYRAVLRKGNEAVAVKVQRPGVRESIALDIYILRWIAGHRSRTLPSLLPYCSKYCSCIAQHALHKYIYVLRWIAGNRYLKLLSPLPYCTKHYSCIA